MTAAAAIRRRRAAAVRCVVLDDGHADPFDRAAAPAGPGTFGLDRAALLREARRLAAEGWLTWEIRSRFARPGGDRA